MKNIKYRIFLGILACSGLLIFFLFQKFDFASSLLSITDPVTKFIFNKSVRFIINDLLAIVLIYALFGERKFIHFAVAVQIAGLIFLLVPYFVLKIYWPAYNGPMINFLHRIILNPTLILLLIPAFYYQQVKSKQ